MSEEKKPQKELSKLSKEELVDSIRELRKENMQLEVEHRAATDPTIRANKEHKIGKNIDKIIAYMNRLDEISQSSNRQHL